MEATRQTVLCRLKSGSLVDNINETLQENHKYEFWILRKIPHLTVLLYAADKLVADTLSILLKLWNYAAMTKRATWNHFVSLKSMLKSLTEDKMNLQIQSVQKSCICLQKYTQCIIEMNIGLKVT